MSFPHEGVELAHLTVVVVEDDTTKKGHDEKRERELSTPLEQ